MKSQYLILFLVHSVEPAELFSNIYVEFKNKKMVFIILIVHKILVTIYKPKSFDEFYEAKNESKYLAKYSITDKTDASRDFIAERVTNQLAILLKKLDSVLKKDALGLFSKKIQTMNSHHRTLFENK